MTTAQGLDVEEGKDLVTLKELEGGDITCIEDVSRVKLADAQVDDVYVELRT